MSSELILILAAVMMLALLFLKVPVFISILAASTIYFIAMPGLSTQILAQRVVAGIQNTALFAVPFFVCAAVAMNRTGVTTRLMGFCEMVTRRMPGGLAQVNILLSTLMGGMSGSNQADAAMDAKLLVPTMLKNGYPNGFSSAVTAVSAIITPLIPPGISMIIYGSIANVSIGKLFIAGAGPGLMLCVTMMIVSGYIAHRKGYGTRATDRLPAKTVVRTSLSALPALCLPILLIGGIRFGIFTPTEGGSMCIVFALILALFYREMKISDLIESLKETVASTAGIMLIIGTASAFAWILTKEQIPQTFTETMLGMIDSKWGFLLVVNIFLLIVGMFIEGNAAMVVLVPLLAPAAAAYGIDEIQFAIVFIFNMAIGCVTPPVGTLMFVTCGITKCKTNEFIKAAIPFYGVMLFVLLMLNLSPIFTTGLVNLLWS